MGFSSLSAVVLKPGGLYTPDPYGPSHQPRVPIIGRRHTQSPWCQPMTSANQFKASILNFDATKRNMYHLSYLVLSQLYLIPNPSPDKQIIHICPILSCLNTWVIRKCSLKRIPEPLHDPYCNALEYVWWWPAIIGSSRTVTEYIVMPLVWLFSTAYRQMSPQMTSSLVVGW